jgi:hypothetical protein
MPTEHIYGGTINSGGSKGGYSHPSKKAAAHAKRSTKAVKRLKAKAHSRAKHKHNQGTGSTNLSSLGI